MTYFNNLFKPLREEGALKKIGVYFLVQLLFLLVTGVLVFPFILINKMLGVLAFFIFGVPIFIMLYIWNINYTYEYTQAGMQNRETDFVWKKDKLELLKKTVKYFIVAFVYSLPILFVQLLNMLLSTALGLNGYSSETSGGAFVIYICMVFIFGIFELFYSFYIIMPATLQLIKTDTFSEAFKIKSIFRSSVRNRDYNFAVLGFIAIMFTLGILFAISIALTFVIIGFCLLPFVALAFIIFTNIMHPYAIGAAYVAKDNDTVVAE
jgi:hypothetical protein